MPWATLRVSVVDDQSGNPVISSELRLAKLGVAELIADLESDSNGRFEPVDLESGDYTVSLSKRITSLPVFGFERRLGDRLVIRLVRCGTIAGRVTNLAVAPSWMRTYSLWAARYRHRCKRIRLANIASSD